MARPDLLLVNAASRKRVYQALGTSLAAIEPPVWAGLIASYARGKGLGVEVLDAEAMDLGPQEVAEEVARLDPRLSAVVVYGHQPSASTQNMPSASAVTSAIKERDGKQQVLLLGGHVAALPERTLREERADFVATGEGPVTAVELCQALAAGDELSKVRGLMFRERGLVRTTAGAPLVEDLDHEMPGLAWDLLPMKRYRAHNWHCFGGIEREPYAAIYTTLGCPYKCTFCCIQAPFKSGEQVKGLKASSNSYRMWSPDQVVAQIDHLVREYGVKNIKMADEMFVLNPRHVHGICDRLIERGYDLNIWAYARVDTVRPDMTEKLREAGFRWLALGIEAAGDEVRQDVEKDFTPEDITGTIQRCADAGISVIANYIFGLPEDDHASMQSTLDLALELNCEFANFYCAMAYPGSSLYQTALAQGWKLPETWGGYSQHSVDTLPLPTRKISAAEVLRFRDDAFDTYFTQPRYLEMVARKFGAGTAQHVRDMTAHKLVRKNAA
jgi:anaerobic magnesium-protoporphyrin IX monomethyl ester cyclase